MIIQLVEFHLKFAPILLGHVAVSGEEGQVEPQPIFLAQDQLRDAHQGCPSRMRLCCIQELNYHLDSVSLSTSSWPWLQS